MKNWSYDSFYPDAYVLEESIIQNEIEVKKFIIPKFIKTDKTLTLIESLKKYVRNDSIKSLDFLQWSDIVPFSNKNNVNFKGIDNNSKNIGNSKEYDFHKYNDNSYIDNESQETKKPIYEQSTIKVNSEDNVFRSYIQRLEEITNDMKLLNKKHIQETEEVEKLFNRPKINELSEAYLRTRSAFPKFESTSGKDVMVNNNEYSSSIQNSMALNNTRSISDYVLSKKYSFQNNNTSNNQFIKKDSDTLQKEINTVETKNNNTPNSEEYVNKIKNIIHDMLLGYKNELRVEIQQLFKKDNSYQIMLQESLKQISTYLFTLKETSKKDDSLNNKLYANQLEETLKLLKNISLHLNSLTVNYEKLEKEEGSLVQEIKHLERTLENSSKEFFNNLATSLKEIKEDQLEQNSNNNIITQNLIDQFKSLNHNVDSKYKVVSALSEKINNLSSKQEELYINAQAIKTFILNKDKQTDEIQNNNGVVKLIEEIKVNSSSAIKEQSVLNENLYKDMEVIKKSILKLVNEQQKEKISTLPNKNHIKQLTTTTLAETSEGSVKKSDNDVQSYNEASSIHITNKNANASKNAGYKDINNFKKSTQLMAIGKLKEALDLEAIYSVEDLHKEYIDEIIEDKIIESNGKNKSNNSLTNSKPKPVKAENTAQKSQEQSTFVLDTSKFFK